jgi:hypothetical protein
LPFEKNISTKTNKLIPENLLTAAQDIKNDPKILKILKILESRGFEVEYNSNGICLKMECMGIPNAVLDFYVLKSSPKQTRARLRKKTNKIYSEFDDFSFHTIADLEYMRKAFQDSLIGVAKLDRFYYFGYRKDSHYYYAHVNMSEEPEEIILRQKLIEKALVQLKGVDSKIFRKGLDLSGLPRSSIVRLALTRIFRSATEPEELILVASQEAVRIVNAEEWKTLRQLIDSNQINFISNIIYILWEEVSRSYMKKAWETLHG